MIYSLSRSEKATVEFRAAYLFYKAESQEFADRFILAVEETLNSIQQNPMIYPADYEDEIGAVRQALVSKPFPYHIFYEVAGQKIDVLSIYHTSREPEGWKE